MKIIFQSKIYYNFPIHNFYSGDLTENLFQKFVDLKSSWDLLKLADHNQYWILNFLRESDLVKFAKHIPSQKEELLFIDLVENFIKTNVIYKEN